MLSTMQPIVNATWVLQRGGLVALARMCGCSWSRYFFMGAKHTVGSFCIRALVNDSSLSLFDIIFCLYSGTIVVHGVLCVCVAAVNPGQRGQQAGVKRQRSEGNLAWPGGQSHRHLSFVLLKINRDTSVIINTMARYIGIKPSALCTAGNKDKRAVTVQRMTCQRVTATRVASAVKGIQGVYCGNFAYAQRAVALGALQGNQFQVNVNKRCTPCEN